MNRIDKIAAQSYVILGIGFLFVFAGIVRADEGMFVFGWVIAMLGPIRNGFDV